MLNEEIATIFEKMARVLAFKGEDRFRILAYERGAQSLRDVREDLASMAKARALDDIPGIGKDLAEMIEEYIKTRRILRYEKECRGIPDGLIELMSIPGLGPKTLALFHKEYGVKCFEDLKRLLDSNGLIGVRGFGEKKIENLKRGIDLWLASRQRMSIGLALPMAESLLRSISTLDLVEQADVAGSIRRRRETIGDMDLLIAASDGRSALQEIVEIPQIKQVLALGPTRATFIVEGGIQVDVRAVPRESYGAAMQYFTGSKQHNVHLRTIALERGLKLNEYGIFRGKKRLGGEKEEDIYRLLKMPLIPPELREDRGEIEAALEDCLPKLIAPRDIKGDLHAHTNYSDGRSSIEEMVNRAEELGYEYVALTDHSPSARVARGLDRDRLEKKIAEVESLRKKRRGKLPRVLLGAEVDILPDGRLDYPDDILAQFDVVTASVHSSFRQSRDRMTSRLLDAIANPHVHIIGHPTTRQIGSREAVDIDFERVVQAAIEAGIALEVNGSPFRLDLNDTMARAAQSAGAVLAINSDAHSTAQLEQIRYGVFQARRGWIEAKSVVNTWQFIKLERWLKRSAGIKRKASYAVP